MEEIEQSGSDVLVESSPAPESDSSESGSNDNQSLSSKPESKPEAPFHEHPRFKELVQQKNDATSRINSYENQLKEMQRQLTEYSKPKAEKSADEKLIERLKGIDPEFGTLMEQQVASRSELAELKAWRAQADAQRTQTEINSSLERLHTEHKVDASERPIYEAMLRERARSNPNLGLSDLASVYKDVHDTIGKLIESKTRSKISSYSSAKVADSNTPAPSKGTPAKPGNPALKAQYSADPAEARAQIVKNAMKAIRTQQ